MTVGELGGTDRKLGADSDVDRIMGETDTIALVSGQSADHVDAGIDNLDR